MAPAPAAPPGTSPAVAVSVGAAFRPSGLNTSFARRSILALFADGRSRSMVDIYCALDMTSRAVLDAAVAELVAASRLHRTPDQRFSTTCSESVTEPVCETDEPDEETEELDDEADELVTSPCLWSEKRRSKIRRLDGFGLSLTVTEWATYFSRRRETIDKHLQSGKTIEQIAEFIATIEAVSAAHAEADAAGRKTYEGRPCKSCGSTTKRTSNHTCAACNAVQMRAKGHARKVMEACV